MKDEAVRTCNGGEASFHKAWLGLAPGCQLCVHLHLIHHPPTPNLHPSHICHRLQQISVLCDILPHWGNDEEGYRWAWVQGCRCQAGVQECRGTGLVMKQGAEGCVDEEGCRGGY